MDEFTVPADVATSKKSDSRFCKDDKIAEIKHQCVIFCGGIKHPTAAGEWTLRRLHIRFPALLDIFVFVSYLTCLTVAL